MARFSLPDCRWSLFMSVPRRSFSLLFSVFARSFSITSPSVFHLLRLIFRRASPEHSPSARPPFVRSPVRARNPILSSITLAIVQPTPRR